MSKNENRKKSAVFGRIALAAGIVAVLSVAAVFAMPRALYNLRGGDSAEENNVVIKDNNAENADESFNTVFPLELEGGKLLLENVIQFDGINPDCGNESGSNIATVSLTNQSGTYLRQAEISLTIDDGTILHFTVTDIPAGKSVMAFATDNSVLNKDASVADAGCKVEFDEDASLNDELVEVSVNGTHITLKNKTDMALTNLVVYCHCTLGNQYFGGVTYNYTINNLDVGKTTELDAADCILGLAEVVCITVGEP